MNCDICVPSSIEKNTAFVQIVRSLIHCLTSFQLGDKIRCQVQRVQAISVGVHVS